MADAKIKTGTVIVLADTTDHSPTAGNDLGTRTDQIDLTALGTGAARESDKFDFGNATALWEKQWGCRAALEFETEPVTNEVVDFYISFSHSATAGTGNDGYASGSDAAFTGTPATLEEALDKMLHVGSFIVSADFKTTVQVSLVGVFMPLERYGTLVVINRTSDALNSDAGGANEISIRLAPLGDDIT